MEVLLAPVINHLLAQQPWARQRLLSHAGKQAEVKVSGQHLRFRITDGGELEAGTTDAPSDVSIELGYGALKALTEGVDGVMAHVRLTGNAELADTLSFVARHLRWDREADLARLFGPIVGRRMHITAKQVEKAVPETGRRLARNTTEYLVHEGGILVGQDEFDSHLASLRRLRDDLARLAQRIERVSTKTRQPLS